MCRFLDVGNKKAPHAQMTRAQKAPRHEVAGSQAPARQRVLWGFNAGAVTACQELIVQSVDLARLIERDILLMQ
jgi:hypothetical protein